MPTRLSSSFLRWGLLGILKVKREFTPPAGPSHSLRFARRRWHSRTPITLAAEQPAIVLRTRTDQSHNDARMGTRWYGRWLSARPSL